MQSEAPAMVHSVIHCDRLSGMVEIDGLGDNHSDTRTFARLVFAVKDHFSFCMGYTTFETLFKASSSAARFTT